jgi:hypothetical protein
MRHLGGSYLDNPDTNTFVPDVWKRLAEDHQLRTMISVGCGVGWDIEWWSKHYETAMGVEGDPDALARARTPNVLWHDYVLGPLAPHVRYDLGWCAEFVEHVEAAFMANWMATLQACRMVVITFATPGQGGYHHVNEQPEAYWLERFAEYGFEPMPEVTRWMRATDAGGAWGRRTLTAFRNTAT